MSKLVSSPTITGLVAKKSKSEKMTLSIKINFILMFVLCNA